MSDRQEARIRLLAAVLTGLCSNYGNNKLVDPVIVQTAGAIVDEALKLCGTLDCSGERPA